jgi:Ca2+-binding RTX toxin-like protein
MRSTVGNLVRFLPDGGIDTSFGGGLVTAYSRVGGTDPDGLAVDPEGRIVGVGWAGRVSVFRLRREGGPDRTFNGGRYLVVPYGSNKSTPYQVGLQSSGRIVALGESGGFGAKGFALIALHGGTDHTKCLGKRATIVGTANRDEIVGTPRRDVIAALAGKDKVRALGGGDLICGGKGRDTLLGGPGKDRVQQDPVRRHGR